MKKKLPLNPRIRKADAAWLGLQTAQLALEAQQVIALRLAKLARGGPRASREAVLMTTEKLAALADAQRFMLQAVSRGQADAGAQKVVSLYRRRVQANRKRLAKG